MWLPTWESKLSSAHNTGFFRRRDVAVTLLDAEVRAARQKIPLKRVDEASCVFVARHASAPTILRTPPPLLVLGELFVVAKRVPELSFSTRHL